MVTQNFKVLTPPDPNSIPLMILEAKQTEFLGKNTLKIIKAPSGDVSSKKEIKPCNWKSLKETKGLSIPVIKIPPYIFGMIAMQKYGLNSKKDIKVTGMGPVITFNIISRKKRYIICICSKTYDKYNFV